jgi:hypothetical protein
MEASGIARQAPAVLITHQKRRDIILKSVEPSLCHAICRCITADHERLLQITRTIPGDEPEIVLRFLLMTSGRSVLAGGKFGGLFQLRPGLNNEFHGGSAVSAVDGFATAKNSVGRAQMPRGEK